MKTVRKIIKRAINPIQRVARRIRTHRIGVRFRLSLAGSSADRTQQLIQKLEKDRLRAIEERVDLHHQLEGQKINERKRTIILARLAKNDPQKIEVQIKKTREKLRRIKEKETKQQTK